MLDEFAKAFSTWGPTPLLFAGCGVAVWWLAGKLNVAEERERKVRDELVTSNRESLKALNDASNLVKESLAEHDRIIDKHTDAINRLTQEVGK